MTIDEQAATRLATYGTLAPGRPNAHQLADVGGTWTTGVVRRRLVEQGWGAAMGYPALVLDPAGEAVSVHLLQSANLPDHWARLDEFEGSSYARFVVQVETTGGEVPVYIYVHASPANPAA